MNPLLVLWMLWLAASAVAIDSGRKEEPAKPFLRGLETTTTQSATSILCRVMQVDVQYMQQSVDNHTDVNTNGHTDESYVCVVDSTTTEQDDIGLAYGIELTEDTLGQLNLQDDDQSWVLISDCLVDEANAFIAVLPNATVTVVTNDDDSDRRRRLAPSIGESTVLILRITYQGKGPTISADDLANSVFGLGNHPPASLNLASQMEACSFGKLVLVPAVGNGIVNGVAELAINKQVSGDHSVLALENLVIGKANARFGTLSKTYEHVFVVVPETDSLKYDGGSFLAYAFVRGYLSVYSDQWAGSITVLAHEIGHNMNLHHAGTLKDGKEYGDVTGYMGFATSQEIKSCFNAQKHWALGWFKDRALSLVVEDLPWAGYLAAFVDYDMTTSDQYVLVNVGQSDPRLFLQYNRAKGINADTREHRDQVVIVRDTGAPSTFWGLKSWLLGGIAKGQHDVPAAFRYKNFGGQGVDLVIRVCKQVTGPPDFVRLSIHLDDGLQQSTCQDEIVTRTDDTGICDDDLAGSFFVDRRGIRTCSWLKRNLEKWKPYLCINRVDAYHVCAETCGKCTDNCHDTPDVTFWVNNIHKDQNCEWLSTRPASQTRLCKEGSPARELCAETCHDCRG